MKDIVVRYVLAKAVKTLPITFTSRGLGDIMIENYCQGQAVFAQNKWDVLLNDKSELNNAHDIQLLIKILKEGTEKFAPTYI